MSENEAKRKRQPVRTPQEKLEDAFMDLSVHGQVKALATFQTLHRMKMRLTGEAIAKVLALPGVTTHEAVNGDCRVCEPYSDASEGHPFVMCNHCGRKVFAAYANLDGSGQFSAPETSQGSLIDGAETASRAKP